MENSKLITTKNGSRCLIVPYQGDAFDSAIREAEAHYNLAGDPSVTVIALPYGMNNVLSKQSKKHNKQLQILKQRLYHGRQATI